MAIGKKSSGSRRAIGAESDAAKAEKKRIAAQLAQKAAQENIAANRQLETARAHAATPGKANAQLTRAQLISAPTPSRLKDRQKHDREMQAERLAHSASESKLAREHSASESKLSREHQSAESKLARENQLHMQDISLWNQRQMNTERLNHQNRQAKLDRDFREKLNERGIAAQKERDTALHGYQTERDNILHGYNKERDEANRAHDKAMKDAQIAAQKERDATLHGYQTERDKTQRDDALAKWYRQQDYLEQQRIDAENAQYGIPKNSGISAEDRAKIINGKGAYKYEFGRTEKDEEQIKAMEEALYSPDATESDKVEIAHELEIFKEEHPPVGRAVKVPVEERAPQTTVIGGVTYMNNNGRWEPVQTPKQEAPVPTTPQIVTREDGTKWLGNGKGGFTPYTDPKDAARQKYMQDLLKKEVPTGKNTTEGDAKTRPLTPQEIAEEMARYDEVVLGKKNTPLVTQRVNPVTGLLEAAFNGAPTNPMAGGSEAQPPSVAPTPMPAPTPTPTPTPKTPPPMPDPTIYSQALSPVGIQPTVGGIPLTGFMNGPVSEPPNIEAIQASLPEGMAVLPPNKNGQFFIIDSTGNRIGYVDAQGVKWKIIYDQNGKPMGKVPMQ